MLTIRDPFWDENLFSCLFCLEGSQQAGNKPVISFLLNVLFTEKKNSFQISMMLRQFLKYVPRKKKKP